MNQRGLFGEEPAGAKRSIVLAPRPTIVDSDAVFCPQRVHRYMLKRGWDRSKPYALWILHNPSKAGALPGDNDPTVKRVISFSHGFGFGGFYLVNPWSFIATEPVELWNAKPDRRVGPGNDDIIKEMLDVAHGTVIIGWGGKPPKKEHHPFFKRRTDEVLELIRAADRIPYCLGKNADGTPRHPLYLQSTTRIEAFL